MTALVDLHHHLDTLNRFFQLRSRWQGHKISPENFISTPRTLINVAFYVSGFQGYSELRELIISLKKRLLKWGGAIKLITHANDLEQDFQLGLFFHVESARILKSPQSQLPELYELGVRGIIPVHFKDNHLGASCDDILRRLHLNNHDYGLTKQGQEFIQQCNQLNLWVDLSHSSEQTGWDILELAKYPMISHVGVRELIARQRNKPLTLLKKIAEKKGIIGLTPWKHLVGDQPTDYIQQFHYLKQHGLLESLGMGTDFGAPIATHHAFKSPYDLKAKLEESFTKEEVQLICHGNALRFFRHVLANNEE